MKKMSGLSFNNPNPIQFYPEFNKTKIHIHSAFVVKDFTDSYDTYGDEDVEYVSACAWCNQRNPAFDSGGENV